MIPVKNMKEEDIKKIIGILSTADSGCVYCASSLTEKFIEAFNVDKKLVLDTLRQVQKEHYWDEEKYLEKHFDYLFDLPIKE